MPDEFWQGRAERGAKGETSFFVIAYADDEPIGMAVPDGHFGAAAALYMLYHFAEPREVLAESHRVLRTGGLFAASAPSQLDNPELAGLLLETPLSTFDSEIGPDLVRGFFQDVEVQTWDAPLLPLPDVEALLLWLRHQGLPDAQARKVAPQVSLPLTLTKRGALTFGYKRP
jgi:SAM-dependent methyltransferase